MAKKIEAKRVRVVVDRIPELRRAVAYLQSTHVLVGIPAASIRIDGQLDNSELGYIQEFGSPAAQIPPRPFLIPGVNHAHEEIVSGLKQAGAAALHGNMPAAEAHMQMVGIEASQSVKTEISSNIPPPLKPSTIRNRRRSRGTISMRVGEKQYGELVKNGSSPADAQQAAGVVSLINTGQLRDAITYVVTRDKLK